MIILDSSVWIALIREQDSQHGKCESLINILDKEEIELYDFNYGEILNVLKKKTPSHVCESFIKFLDKINLNVKVSNLFQLELANDIFFKNLNNNISFTDCLFIATAKLLKAQLITFDKELQKVWAKSKLVL